MLKNKIVQVKENIINEKLSFFGNKDILENYKTVFLCSKKYPSEIVLKSLDWAIEKKNNGECVISGFHSRIEKDVFNILIKGKQPIILVLARGMKKYWPAEIKKAIEEERLLVISPFDKDVKYITQENANIRNELMTKFADEIFIAYSAPNGNLDKLIKNSNGKNINHFRSI